VVAEGVETAEQRDWLRAAGCDLDQGYFFGRPMAPQEFADWLARRAAPAAAARTQATAQATA
jgi:sensor c-di-GMP phosphodiesterase-like protein